MVWQLLQVRHLHDTPLILAGAFWDGLLDWAQDVDAARPTARWSAPRTSTIPQSAAGPGPTIVDVHPRAPRPVESRTRRPATVTRTHRRIHESPRGRRPRGQRPAATSSPDTGAGRSSSPARTTPCTSGGWCSTTSSTRRTPGPREQFEAVAAAIRDVLAQRWVRTQQDVRPGEPEAGLLPVDGVPDRPVAGEQHHQPDAVARWSTPPPEDEGAEAGRTRRAGAGRRPGQRRPRPAGRVLHRLAGHARRSRPSATACGTTTASSARRSATATRSNTRTPG